MWIDIIIHKHTLKTAEPVEQFKFNIKVFQAIYFRMLNKSGDVPSSRLQLWWKGKKYPVV